MHFYYGAAVEFKCTPCNHYRQIKIAIAGYLSEGFIPQLIPII